MRVCVYENSGGALQPSLLLSALKGLVSRRRRVGSTWESSKKNNNSDQDT